jgi:hypothetical protein
VPLDTRHVKKGARLGLKDFPSNWLPVPEPVL